ncbi:MAG: hypothetical protein IT445_19315 [Phycisphaeraceae bacterium]|nr:hypothetical protein [Phycisphaeraceae bacterium]
MPVSYLPCITPLILFGVPLLLLITSRRAAKIAAGCSVCVLALLLLAVYVPDWWLYAKAARGDATVQYQYAQWLENHSERIGAIILWPSEPDVLGGYAWLEKAAAQDYPPAVWLVGVRLKYGQFVPKPPGWTGPAGNFFPQPGRGQPIIDRAVNQLGYEPPSSEDTFYYTHYRRGLPP